MTMLELVLPALLAVGWCGERDAAHKYEPSFFGINGIKYEFIYKNPEFPKNAVKPAQAMQAARIYWDRDGIQWRVVEPEKGKWDWKCVDGVAAMAREWSLSHIILLYGSSVWSNGVPPHDDDERAAFAEYVYQVVNRLKEHVGVWEIWNEPNIPSFWPKPNVRDYTLLLREAYKAAKRADPTATVLAGSTSGPDLGFIKGIYENGGWDYLDGVSIHPYSMAGGPIAQRFDKILRMINAFIASTGKPKPLWITEMGWTARTPEEERDQAIYLVQAYVIARANGVEKLCWFDLVDWGEKWGIVKSADPLEPKLAHTAYKLMATALGSPGPCAEFKGYLKMPEGAACYVFAKGEKDRVLFLWSNDDRTRTVQLSQRNGLTARDILDKPVEVDRGRINVGPVPVIVMGADAAKIGRVSADLNPYLERPGRDLLDNGSFEVMRGSKPGWWNAGGFDSFRKDGTFSTESAGRDGGKCVSISASGERAAWDAAPIPVDAGKRYRLTVWAKTKDATGSTQAGLFWYTGNMWTYLSEVRSEPITGATDWRQLSVEAVAPKDAVFVRVNLTSENNSGAAWFDDAALVETE
jgi:hypothetical protein